MTSTEMRRKKALRELEQEIGTRCLGHVVKNDAAGIAGLLDGMISESDVAHAGNYVFSVKHCRAEQILIFTKPVMGSDEYIRVTGYNVEPKKEQGITPVRNSMDVGEADKDLIEFARTIDFRALYNHIKDFTRVSCGFGRPQIEIGRENVHITFTSENIACMTGAFVAILERCHYLEEYRREYCNFILTGKTEEDEKVGLCIEAYPLKNGWVEGDIGCYRFQAKVYGIGSKYGINGGRVSKLEVWGRDSGAATAFIRYDRGWDAEPSENEHRELLRELLKFLEALPAE